MSARSPTEAAIASPAGVARPAGLRLERLAGLLLVAPALLTVFLFFLYPLGYSVGSAFAVPGVGWSLGNFEKAIELYATDILFTLVIVGTAAAITAVLAIAIGGYLTLGECAPAVAILRWLYRWPLFIPFIVTGQIMRSFLGKNGLMNHALLEVGLITPLQAQSFLDWRGIVVAFVWKQTPFVTLMVAGAMASLDRSLIEAARNLGAGRLRILLGIIVPQVLQTLLVALILSFVTMMSVLSVPVMINAGTPTMLTVDMAFRITAYGDYGVANALGCLSYLMTGVVAWIYLRHGVQRASAQ